MSKLYNTKVTGQTTIIHEIRLSMGLSYAEYIVMDYLWRHRKTPGLAVTEMIFYPSIGMDKQAFQQILNILCSRNQAAVYSKEIFFCSQWLDYFSGVERISELMEIFKNKGNKVKAGTNLTKALTMTDINTIISKAKEYMESVKDSERKYILSLDSWLDPKLKRWEQVFIEPNKQQIVSWKK